MTSEHFEHDVAAALARLGGDGRGRSVAPLVLAELAARRQRRIGLAAAASVALAVGAWSAFVHVRAPAQAPAPGPDLAATATLAPAPVPVAPAPSTPAAAPVIYMSREQAEDQEGGIIQVQDGPPLREVRRNRVQTRTWIDRERGVEVREVRPSQEVRFIMAEPD